jgi:preprotein translocase subunit SecA
VTFSKFYATTRSKHFISKTTAKAGKISSREAFAKGLSDEALRSSFQALKDAPQEVATIDGFALCREAARRTLGQRPYDVQMLGGLLLSVGKLAEMRTGEGKTLTIVAPAAVLALFGKGVHVVTANTYLAQRDAELMRPVYEILGLSVGAVFPGQSKDEKRAAYACDVTYGVGSEFGFDYLKDHLVRLSVDKVQRGLHAAIVDEVDSILIDEARVPLIIANPDKDRTELTLLMNGCAGALTPGLHYLVKTKDRTADLTEEGYAAVEQALVTAGELASPSELYDTKHLSWVRQLHSAVRAHALYQKDRDYVLVGDEVVLVDTGTGRKMSGRRLEDGLHEALEAKEGRTIQVGTVTQATVTYQNFFGLYERLAGLTGTALTDADEFNDLYNLETVVVPTNRPLARVLHEDVVYLTKQDKFAAVVEEARVRSAAGQPVLIGAATVRDAEVIDNLLSAGNIEHATLTAKYIEQEASIISQAGRKGRVTVATNMAGRGTDIALGGERPNLQAFDTKGEFEVALGAWNAEREEVLSAGGLFVLGTERNGVRRVDNQLAGRCGRQGDPGEVQFLLSLEDELLKTFGQAGKLSLVRKLIDKSGRAMSGATIDKLVLRAQEGMASQGFTARQELMKYDSAQADQRLAVYGLRNALLEGGCLDHVRASIEAALDKWTATFMPDASFPDLWEAGNLKGSLSDEFGLALPILGWVKNEDFSAADIRQKVITAGLEQFDRLSLSEEAASDLLFSVLDDAWTDHLAALQELRENVSLKGQTNTGLNPLFQYHKEAFDLFQSFDVDMNHTLAATLLSAEARAKREALQAAKMEKQASDRRVAEAHATRWVTRNEPCPCESGLRFRFCHGKLTK